METWKQIDDTRYYVSNYGNVQSRNYKNSGNTKNLLFAQDKKKYLRCALMIDGKLVTYKVHRLVASAFIPNFENKPQVNHINGIKTDNRAENLEWVTNSENQIHAIKLGLSKIRKGHKRPDMSWVKGEGNKNSILKEHQVLEIRKKFKKRIYTREMLAKEYGVKPSTIKDIILRNSWNHL